MSRTLYLRLFLLTVLSSVSALAAYTYDYTKSPVITDFTRWQSNGTATIDYTVTTFTASGGSLISKLPISGVNQDNYEISSTLHLPTFGGTYILFVRTDSQYAQSGSGSYISAEISSPAYGSATLNINQSISGTVSNLSSSTIAVNDGMTFRATIQGTLLWVYANNVVVATQTVPLTSGNPGFGGYSTPTGYGFTGVKLGPHDSVAPTAVTLSSVTSSIFPTQVSLKWVGTADDVNGIGLYGYQVVRGGYTVQTVPTPYFVDATLSASGSYGYQIFALDQHGNASTGTSITINTPPASAIDPRRTGVHSTGSYWGAGGEQIDTLSGNLNYSLPLVTVQGRAGSKNTLVLSYNAQNWRQDSGVNWELGFDTGYGYGWKVQTGSITPYYFNWTLGVHHYVFTDTTGAEYRLDVNTSGIWSSTQGIQVWFDPAANILHFKDGSFWVMGSTSGGTEADAGTLYPTILEDLSGNQVILKYLPGAGMPSTAFNTSARITSIEDARAQNSVTYTPYSGSSSTITGRFSYTFTFNGDTPIPHLVSIANWMGTPETYTFTYSGAVALAPPFGYDAAYAGVTTTRLNSLDVGVTGTYSFTYDTANSAELTQTTLPGGGHQRWSYVTFQYNGARSLREVSTRYLAADSAGATEWAYPFTHPDAANTVTAHTSTTLADASTNGAKTWNFSTTSGPAWRVGLATEYLQKATPTSTSAIKHDTYTWSQDAAGNPYISTKVSVTDEGTSNQQSAQSTQTADQFGNITQSVVYPFNNTTTPLRTFTNTYLDDSTYPGAGTTYISNYVRNRLVSSALTGTGVPTGTTLVQNWYDGHNYAIHTDFCSSYGSVTFTSPTITNEMDSSPPVAFSGRGILSESVNPAVTSCYLTYNYGVVYQSAVSSGHTVTQSADSATNYAAPQTITTESSSATIAYNAWLGVNQTTGANGEQLQISYDTSGRPATATSPFGAVTTYAYTAAGTVPMKQTVTGPGGFTRTTLDGVGRPIRVERGPSSASILTVIDTVYSPCACTPLGKMQKVSQPYAPGASTLYWTTYGYDAIGRTLSVQMPDAASTATYSYSGNQATATDAAGKWKTMTSDVQGNLTTVLEPNPAGGTFTTSYTYDWMNHLAGTSMTRGSTTQTRTFAYDNLGRLTSAVNPENGTASYYYNSDNSLWYRHDANGQDTVFTYDSAVRVTMIKRYPTGRTNSEDTCGRVNYYYDTNPYSTTFSLHTVNRLAAVSYGSWGTPSGCLTGENQHAWYEMYSYHAAGAVTAKQLAVSGGGTATVSYTYDSAGRPTATTYPVSIGGSTVSDTFTTGLDGMGRPVSLTGSESPTALTWVQNVVYDQASRMTSIDYRVSPAGSSFTTEALSFNTNGQLGSMGWSGSGSPVTGSLTYGYSATQNNGQITQVVDSISGETIVYQYDSLKRLTSAASTPNVGTTPTAWTETYGYGGFGNLTGKTLNGTTTTIAADPTTNRLSSASYDSNGNMTSGVGATFTFDVANRALSAVETSGGVEYYGYAPDNKRIYKKLTSGAEEYTFYGARGEKLGAYNLTTSTAVALRTSVWFAGRLISENGSAVFQDRLGTNRASGARFRPYGDEITSTSNDREKFGTYTRDGYTGLDYADQRFYASGYGRFNSPDPYKASGFARDPASWNRYAYTRGDPVGRFDPRGLADTTCVIGTPPPGGVGDPPIAEFFAADECGDGPGGSSGGVDPQAFAYDFAKADQDLVSQGHLSDCQALAAFAGVIANYLTSSEFVQAFGVLVDQNDGSVQTAQRYGISLAANTNPVILLPSDVGATYGSGFFSQYQESLDSVNIDQGHHFAAFFQIGYLAGSTFGSFAALEHDLFNNGKGINPGDIALGTAAVAIGSALADHLISVSQVSEKIKTLCK